MVSIAAVPLPEVDPDRQALVERLALLVESAADDTNGFRTRIEREPATGVWFGGADGVALRIDEIDGAATALHPERIDAAVDALEFLEPLLDLIEAATGWVIEPEEALDRPVPGAIVLGVDALRNGARVARFALALPEPLADVAAAEASLTAERLGDVPVLCNLHAAAVWLPVEEAGAMAPGDLLVLEPAPWAATLHAAPLDDIAILFDPGTGRATCEGNKRVSDVQVDGTEQNASFRVPIEVRLEGGAATLGELAALREGGALVLGSVTDGLRVTLSVGGRPLGTGEMVRLGDRFAVIVEHLSDLVDSTENLDAGARD